MSRQGFANRSVRFPQLIAAPTLDPQVTAIRIVADDNGAGWGTMDRHCLPVAMPLTFPSSSR